MLLEERLRGDDPVCPLLVKLKCCLRRSMYVSLLNTISVVLVTL